MSSSPFSLPDDAVTVLPAGRTVFGMQLPVQSQSTIYVQPWEPAAGPDELAGAMSTTWFDTIATLGWLAGFTTDIRLLSHIYVIALRHPLRSAKEFATVDAP